jgi:hypothetical protein
MPSSLIQSSGCQAQWVGRIYISNLVKVNNKLRLSSTRRPHLEDLCAHGLLHLRVANAKEADPIHFVDVETGF